MKSLFAVKNCYYWSLQRFLNRQLHLKNLSEMRIGYYNETFTWRRRFPLQLDVVLVLGQCNSQLKTCYYLSSMALTSFSCGKWQNNTRTGPRANVYVYDAMSRTLLLSPKCHLSVLLKLRWVYTIIDPAWSPERRSNRVIESKKTTFNVLFLNYINN